MCWEGGSSREEKSAEATFRWWKVKVAEGRDVNVDGANKGQ